MYCEKGSYTCNYKYRFEILNAVYLENAWCHLYAILYRFVVMQDNSMDVLFNGLLDELPNIFRYTSDYIGLVGQGWWGAIVVSG